MLPRDIVMNDFFLLSCGDYLKEQKGEEINVGVSRKTTLPRDNFQIKI